jgi:hypothetical protein
MGGMIETELEEAGYTLLGRKNIYDLVLNILESKNTRYLKAIPFLIYKYDLDIEKFNKLYSNKLFKEIIGITKQLFYKFEIKKKIPLFFTSYSTTLDFNEFADEFELQIKNIKSDLFLDKQKIYAERELEMSLSKIFTKKERQIIKRLLDDKPISKTDYEYYSRLTKKKLNSIINLEDFAKSIFNKNPLRDDDLFDLKKKLEEFIEETSSVKNISLIEFYLWDENKISLIYTILENQFSDKFFDIQVKLGQIKDEHLLSLLKKYGKHKFN